jgi:hypothetical protein
MSRIFITGLLCVLSIALLQAQELNTPAPSPLGTVTQIVGVTEVSVTYSRPGVKGRDIFGGLVPYGELWRTGANMSTKIKFGDDVMLDGKNIPAGEYALFTIPDKSEWTIIISPNMGPGTSKYKKEDDIARFTVKPGSLNKSVERLTIGIADVTDNSARIVICWAMTEVSFDMTVDTDANVMAQIEKVMKNPDLDDGGTYMQAAYYYYHNDKDTKQAFTWVNKAIELEPDAFWISRLKAQIQAKMGDYAAAIKTAEHSMEQAEKAGNEQYVAFNRDAIAEWKTKL